MDIDYKFWATFLINLVGIGIMAWQVRIMKGQIASAPSPRSPRRIELQKQLARRLWIPVYVMVFLILLSWFPYVIAANQRRVLPSLMVEWGGTATVCTSTVDTSPLAKAANKYRLFLACSVVDPSVDAFEDARIAVSKPFNITGNLVNILITYDPSSEIAGLLSKNPKSAVQHYVLLLPKDQDGSRIERLSDVEKQGGQVLFPGSKLKL